MKKIFNINSNPNKKPARQLDAIKHEINKYLSRERRKDLPEGVDYWDFNCKIGDDAASAADVHVSKINTEIDNIVGSGKEEFYLQVKAIKGLRKPKKDQ